MARFAVGIIIVLTVMLLIVSSSATAPARAEKKAEVEMSGITALINKLFVKTLTVTKILKLRSGAVIEFGDGTTQDTAAGGAAPKVYRALLAQSGTNAPVATVLENTLGGTVVWTRGTTGEYYGTLSGAFPPDKTFCSVNNVGHGPGYIFVLLGTTYVDVVVLKTYQDGVAADGLLTDAAYSNVEILVYP